MTAIPPDLLLAFHPDKPVTLPGCKCAYCRRDLQPRTTTKDHVVARNFVPQGTLANGFHLQVKSCRACNDRKARLEDDISLITMLPDTAGKYVNSDERLLRTVKRKAKGAISPVTRKLVAESYNQVHGKYPIGGGVSMNLNGTAMPTLDDKRVAQLAYYQVQGFSFFRSFNRELRYGAWLQPDKFTMLGQLINADWGNPQLRFFMEETAGWERTALIVLADGYFQHVMFKKPDVDLFAWALEWNGRLRVFGLYGDVAEQNAYVSAQPVLRADFAHGDTVNGFVMRYDTPLDDDHDILFALPNGFEDRPFAAPHWKAVD